MSIKYPLTPAGIEPAIFRFVAQHFNQCATAVPQTLSNTVLNDGVFIRPFISASQRDVSHYFCVKSCSVMKKATDPISVSCGEKYTGCSFALYDCYLIWARL